MDSSIDRDEYQAFCVFLREACGIMLGDNKHYLVSSRLAPLMQQRGLGDMGALLAALKSNRPAGLMQQVIDAMTTNETSWFRDGFLFDALGHSLFSEFAQRREPLRIWSAACSSGQEPYSISMAVHEFNEQNPGRTLQGTQILATDISPSMLRIAESGVYDAASLSRGMSPERQQKYFRPHGRNFTLRADIRKRVSFREFNLTQNCQSLGKFDMVFCRNVLIYFASELKRDIIGRIVPILSPGGYFFVGAAETLASHTEAFDMQRIPGGFVYKLKTRRHRTPLPTA